jgi:hypothetical protein
MNIKINVLCAIKIAQLVKIIVLIAQVVNQIII